MESGGAPPGRLGTTRTLLGGTMRRKVKLPTPEGPGATGFCDTSGPPVVRSPSRTRKAYDRPYDNSVAIGAAVLALGGDGFWMSWFGTSSATASEFPRQLAK